MWINFRQFVTFHLFTSALSMSDSDGLFSFVNLIVILRLYRWTIFQVRLILNLQGKRNAISWSSFSTFLTIHELRQTVHVNRLLSAALRLGFIVDFADNRVCSRDFDLSWQVTLDVCICFLIQRDVLFSYNYLICLFLSVWFLSVDGIGCYVDIMDNSWTTML